MATAKFVRRCWNRSRCLNAPSASRRISWRRNVHPQRPRRPYALSGRKALLASCARSSRTIWLKVLRFQTVLYRSHVPRRTSAERPLPRILSGRMRIFRQPGSVGGRGNYCAARCSAYCGGIQSWTCASTLSDVPIAGPSIKALLEFLRAALILSALTANAGWSATPSACSTAKLMRTN